MLILNLTLRRSGLDLRRLDHLMLHCLSVRIVQASPWEGDAYVQHFPKLKVTLVNNKCADNLARIFSYLASIGPSPRSLEICAGSGRWSSGMNKIGLSNECHDILVSKAHDLRSQAYCNSIQYRASTGDWCSCHIGVCCTTFSRAANPPYISSTTDYWDIFECGEECAFEWGGGFGPRGTRVRVFVFAFCPCICICNCAMSVCVPVSLNLDFV